MTRLLLNNWTLVGSSNLIFSALIIDLSLLVIFTAWKMTSPRFTSNSLALIMEPSISVNLASVWLSISGTGSHSVSVSLARPAVMDPLFNVTFLNLNSFFTITVQLLYRTSDDEFVNLDVSMKPSLYTDRPPSIS